MTTSDWHRDHPEYDGPPDEPREYADTVDFDTLKKKVLEATAADQQAVWQYRRSKFLRWLDTFERIWFG